VLNLTGLFTKWRFKIVINSILYAINSLPGGGAGQTAHKYVRINILNHRQIPVQQVFRPVGGDTSVEQM